jgi:hypothetical protein
MAKRKSDPGKAIAERNLQEMSQGQVPVERNGQTVWVDPGSLSAKQQQEEATQSNTPPVAALPKAVRDAVAANQPAAAASPESAYQQLADAQAKQYLQMTQNLDPLTSGASMPAIEATTNQGAEQMLGASATSPVSQWLNAQTSAAAGQNAPAAAAASQVSSAQDQAAQLEASGLKNLGAAENQMMQAAPYQQLLSSLAADVPYKLLSNYTMPQIQSTLKSAESQLGLSTAGAPTANAPQLPPISSGTVPTNLLSQFQPQGAPQT